MARGSSALHGGVEAVLVAAAFAVTYLALGTPDYLGGVVNGRESALPFVAPMMYVIALRLPRWDPLRSDSGYGIVLSSAAAFLGIFTVLAALMCDSAEEETLVLWWSLCAGGVATALIIAERTVYRGALRSMRARGIGVRSAIIVTDSAQTAERFLIEARLTESAKLIGFLGDEDVSLDGMERLGDLSDLDGVLGRFNVDFVIFALQNMENSSVIRLVDLCCDRCVDVYILPTACGYFKSERQLEYFGSMPAINAYFTPLESPALRLVKRTVDVVGALALLLLSTPVMLIAAVGVKLSSPGPVLFRQTRVGYRGEYFTMLKLRSMVQNDSSDTAWSRGIDTRKTRFGNFLRRTSIDELPQLVNVLRGEMSLVGPRPEIPIFVEKFKTEIPLYMLKHKVKPGMTGLAQIRGLRGDTSIADRINADLHYIENWSLGLDLKILLQTPFRAINRREKYTAPEDEPHESAPRRILYVASTAGHLESFHRPYIEAMRARGDEVLLMARGGGVDFDIPFSKRMLSADNIAAWREVRRVLREQDFDAIVLNTMLAALIVRAALPRRDRPRVVNIVHGYLFGNKGRALRSKLMLTAEIALRSRTDTVLTMNGEDFGIARRYRLGRRVEMIRGMGAVARRQITSPESLRRELCAENSFVLCFVGELSRRKNQEMLIRAMPRLRSRIPTAVLWLVGEGRERQRQERLAEDLGVKGCVTFFGYRSDACDFMRACDLYVSAARSEGLPFNVLEALSCGKAVLASVAKGHADIIEDGKDGFLFEFDNYVEFVNKSCQIYEKKMVIAPEIAMRKYENYSLEAVFTDTLKAIDKGVGDGGDTDA